MAEDLKVITGTKEEQYQSLLPQVQALLEGEQDQMANLANLSAALKQQFNWFWVGFYRVCKDELIVGPFQGPVACTRIQKGRGVCGESWAQEKTMIVDNVNEFPGHIACNTSSRSEIVIPVKKDGKVVMVLDIDSDRFNQFDAVDERYLKEIIRFL